MTKINIQRFTHYSQRSFLRFLREQPDTEFAISIPKRKTPADGARAMFEEYFTATYVGQILSRTSEKFFYVLPDPNDIGTFCYLIKARSLYALSKALTYIAGGYSKDSDRAACFYDDIWSFIDRMEDHERIACGEYFETANDWANEIEAEYNARRGMFEEEPVPESLAQETIPFLSQDSEITGPLSTEAHPDAQPKRSLWEPPTSDLQPPASGCFPLPSDIPPMISLHIPQFFGYDKEAILDYLHLQEANQFCLLIPKRTALGRSGYSEIAEEYTAVAYIAQRLHQAGASYTLDYPALHRTGNFVFDLQTDNLPQLAALLEMLVLSYESGRLETSELYVQALYMVARAQKAEIHCTDCIAIATQFWHMERVEWEEKNDHEEEEEEEDEDEEDLD